MKNLVIFAILLFCISSIKVVSAEKEVLFLNEYDDEIALNSCK